MNITVVRYRVKPEQADHNKDLVAAVYDELDRTQPDGLHYATFIADDRVSFTHMAVVKPGVEPHPLTSLAAFQRFTAGIEERCDEPPAPHVLEQFRSYRFVEPGRRL